MPSHLETARKLKTSIAPSIFNDAIGPIMRGPSSSHCAAAYRIGRLCLDLLDGEISSLRVDYDENGALKTTHIGQGTDMGLYSGILGYAIDDDRLPRYQEGLAAAGIEVSVNYLDYGALHPNNYRLTLGNSHETHVVEAISTGGGMIELQKIDGTTVCIVGDYYELLVFYAGDPAPVQAQLTKTFDYEFMERHQSDSVTFFELKSATDFAADSLNVIAALDAVNAVKVLKPVLPVLSRANLEVPFITTGEMMTYNEGRDLALWELAVAYESRRGNISADAVFEKMRDIARIMKFSLETGMVGSNYQDRILPPQAPKLKAALAAGLLPDDIGNRLTLYTTAMMDVKSALGVIVAAPTAGSCGTLPGAIWGAASFWDLAEDDVVKALLAAGLIGVFIAAHATFAAEVAGCMAETGAGGAMAAAGLVQLQGGNAAQALNAASKALGASLGLVCDMIGDRVEVPCLDKNVSAAHKALAVTNMALAGYTAVIPLDEVIDAMFLVGESMPRELCCTGLGGLAITPTGQQILLQLTSVDANTRLPGKFWKAC